MKNRKHLLLLGAAALTATAALAGYQAGRARAGVPAKSPLVYTGILESDGKPAPDGDVDIAVSVYSEAADGAPLAGCDDAAEPVPVKGGLFAVTLSDACVKAIEAADHADLWVAVEVSGTELAPRAKIAAVPFALQARQADGLTEKARSQITYPDCPPDYTKLTSSPGGRTWCARGADVVVRIGLGATSFWMDRYEASVWANADGTGAQSFTAADSAPAGLPVSGVAALDAALPFAISKWNASPARHVSWLQAETLCRGVGKRLPSGREWLAAVQGTADPGHADGTGGTCRTCVGAPGACDMAAGPRNTGGVDPQALSSCASRWGVDDMIGNVAEWVGEWHMGVPSIGTEYPTPADQFPPWPTTAGFGGDGMDKTSGLNTAVKGNPQNIAGAPGVEDRGGSWASGDHAGAFALQIVNGPYTTSELIGFRCMIPR